MAAKEFVTAVQEKTDTKAEAEERMTFSVDGVEYVAFKPDPAQLAVAIASTGSHSSDADKIAGIINFFVAVLDDRAHAAIVARLLDRKDPFGLEEVQDIMEWMVEEWTGRPTESLSVSTP